MSLGAGYYPTVRREPSLVSYWRLNDPAGSLQATDYGSRYGLVGFYNGAPSPGPALIQADQTASSYVFGLSSKSVSIGDAAPLQIIGDISIELWAAVYTASQSSFIINKTNAATFANPYILQINAGAVAFLLGNGTTQTQLLVGSALPISIPTHIVATSFRGTMTIYINGVAAATRSLGAQVVSDGGQSLFIGTSATGGAPFGGLIGEAAIYNGALSARRVARHFTVGQQVIPDPAHFYGIDPPVYS